MHFILTLMNLKCVVIDDEQYAVDAMLAYIEQTPGLVNYTSYTDPLIALSSITAKDEIDFIFLDIEMPKLSGLELATSLRDKTKFLVLTTSHTIDAVISYDLNVSQYLLKPFSYGKFVTTIDRLIKQSYTIANVEKNKPYTDNMFIKAEYKGSYYAVNPKEIICVEANGHYVIIQTTTVNYFTHLSLKQMELSLGTENFIRISKSIVVAKAAIVKVDGNTVKLKYDREFLVGEVYRPTLLNFIKANMY